MKSYETPQPQQQPVGTESEPAPAVDLGLGGAEQWGNAAAAESVGLGAAGAGGGPFEDPAQRKNAAMWNPAVRDGVAAVVAEIEAEYLFQLRVALEQLAEAPESLPASFPLLVPIDRHVKIELPPEVGAPLGATPGRFVGVRLALWTLPIHVTEVSPGELWTTITGSCGDFVMAQLVDHTGNALAAWWESLGVGSFTVRSTAMGMAGVPDRLNSYGPKA